MVKRERLSFILIIMALASLSVIVPLTFFRSVITVFFIYYIGMCLIVPLVDLVLVRKLSASDTIHFLGLKNVNSIKPIFAGSIHGFIFLAFTVGGFLLLKDKFLSSDIAVSLEQWGVSQNLKWIIFILMVLFNGIVEEIFWRGYTYGKIKNHLNKWLAIFVVTSFYTSYHLATVLTFFKVSYLGFQIVLFIFIAGLLWGWMRYKFNNIWASAIGHTLATIGYMTVYLLI